MFIVSNRKNAQETSSYLPKMCAKMKKEAELQKPQQNQQDIKFKGDIICENDIEYLRPAPVDSYSPYEKEFVLGKKLLINKNSGDYIKKGDLCD